MNALSAISAPPLSPASVFSPADINPISSRAKNGIRYAFDVPRDVICNPNSVP